MKRLFITALLAFLALLALPTSAMAGQTPAKIAVIVEENANWNQIIGNANASYINNTLLGQSLSIDPNSSTCDYPNFDGAGTTGTVACTSGMFQNYRTTKATHFLTSGSAPEYAWLSMGTDGNIRDHVFPCGKTDTSLNPEACFSPAQFDTVRPENGAPGFSPGHFGSATDPAYNIFRALKAQGGTWNVYAEDYLGTSSACSTVSWSSTTGSGPPFVGNFYARKHNPFLLTWDMSPDAAPDSSGGVNYTPTAAPSAADCKSHMQDFPNNTPNGSLVPTTNFAGTEGANFGSVTFIIPSMCHDGHNSSSACGTGRGGTADLDLWLSDNMPGIRKDVGQNGVVVTTWDEDGTGQADGNGHAPPVPTFITPGTDSSGNPSILASGLGANTTGFFSHSSTLKALLASAGSSCSTLDNNVFYQGQTTYGTAQTQCSNATVLPVDLQGPTVVQSPTPCTATATTSLSCSWGSATKAGDLLVATVGVSGSPGTITAPAGWTEIEREQNADIFACTDCASQSGSKTWSWVTSGNSTVIMAEFSGVSGAFDTFGMNTNSSLNSTTVDSGLSSITAQPYELAVADLYHSGTDTLSAPSGGFTMLNQSACSASCHVGFAYKLLTATGTPETTATFTTATHVRGVVVSFKE